MKKLAQNYIAILVLGSALLLSSCSSYRIVVSNPPCFIPYKNFSFKICDDMPFTVDGKKYVIHKGFVTDFASIPRIFWSVYSPNETDTIRASIIHDYLYSKEANVDRAYADSVFYSLLLDDGVRHSKAWLFWLNLRVFGWLEFQQR